MVLKSSFVNQFHENVEQYVLDIGVNIQKENIPVILQAIGQPGVVIVNYGLHYYDAFGDHSISSKDPAPVAGIFWNQEFGIEELIVDCKVETFRFWVRIENGTKSIAVGYPHDMPNPAFVESLLSAMEAALN